jgi:hypothetical protein
VAVAQSSDQMVSSLFQLGLLLCVFGGFLSLNDQFGVGPAGTLLMVAGLVIGVVGAIPDEPDEE